MPGVGDCRRKACQRSNHSLADRLAVPPPSWSCWPASSSARRRNSSGSASAGANARRSSTPSVSENPPTTAYVPSGVIARLMGIADRQWWRDWLAGSPVPYTDRIICARGQHPAAVWRENRGDGLLLVLERRADQPPRSPVPNPDRAIATGGRQQPAIGAESSRVYDIGMRGQFDDRRPRREISHAAPSRRKRLAPSIGRPVRTGRRGTCPDG